MVNPVTWIGLAAAVPEPGVPAPVHDALNEVIGLPLAAPAVKVIVADPFPAVATTLVGAPGTLAGVNVFDVPAAEVPIELVAVTVHVYEAPLVNPVTVIGLDAALPVPLGVPPVHDASKCNTALPLLEPAVNVMVADPLPPVAATLVGAAGTFVGVTELDGAEGKLGPLPLLATTVHVYALPLVSPVTEIGLDAAVPVPGVPVLTGVHVAV